MKFLPILLIPLFLFGSCAKQSPRYHDYLFPEDESLGLIMLNENTVIQIPSGNLHSIMDIHDLTNENVTEYPVNIYLTNRDNLLAFGERMYLIMRNMRPENLTNPITKLMKRSDVFSYRGRAPMPLIAFITPQDGSFFRSNVTVSGAVSAGLGIGIKAVRLKINNGNWIKLDGGTTFSTDIVLPKRTNTIVIAALADNGTILKSTSRTVYKDTTAPRIVINTPLWKDVSAEGIDIEIETPDTQSGLLSVYYRLNGSVSKRVKNGLFSPKNWKNGENKLTITAKDFAGNVRTTNITVIADVTAPDINVLKPTAREITYYTNRMEVSLIVSAKDPVKNQYASGGKTFTLTINSTNEEEFNFRASWTNRIVLTTGRYFTIIRAEDEAGNVCVPEWLNIYLLTNKTAVGKISPDARFGSEICVNRNGDYLITGAPDDSSDYDSGGTVWIHDFSNGGLIKQLSPLNGTSEQHFGTAVQASADGSVIAVGAPGSPESVTSKGRVYVYNYENGGWNRVNILSPSHSTFRDCFGYSLGLNDSGDVLAVGAYQGDTNHTYTGIVYVFTNNGISWLESAALVPYQAELADRFGWDVSLSGNGNCLVVGAPGVNSDYGKVYIYTNSAGKWILSQTLEDFSISSNAGFGFSVGLSGNGSNLIVGAPYDRRPGEVTGSAFYYQLKGTRWNPVGKITESQADSGALFGYACHTDYEGTVIAVSAVHDDNKGAVYLYSASGDGIQFLKRILPLDAYWNDRFGTGLCVSPDGKTLYGGSPDDDDFGLSSGSVYGYSIR